MSREGRMQLVNADVERLTAENPSPMTLEGTNTYVVGRDPAVVIDPGPDDSAHIEAIRAAAAERGGGGGGGGGGGAGRRPPAPPARRGPGGRRGRGGGGPGAPGRRRLGAG